MTDTLITAGDVIRKGRGDHSMVGIVAWVGDTHEDVCLVFLVMPVGDGAWVGTSATRHMLVYAGCSYDDGHQWFLPDGYEIVTEPWWLTFRYPAAFETISNQG